MEKDATEAEMREHCDKYPCISCPLVPRCSLHEKLGNIIQFGWGDEYVQDK